MILSKNVALDLEALMHPDVEEALLKLLDYIIDAEKHVLSNSDAKIEDLKLFQGKYLALTDLKQYKQRILDVLK